MKIKIKKLNSTAVIPTYAKHGDAGMDLESVKCTIEKEYTEYGTGLAIEIPYGYVGLIFPRSSISKKDLILANSVGVIDSGYRGEIKVRFKRTKGSGEGGHDYDLGEEIAQLVILPIPKIEFEEVEELAESERGEGGFGSTNQINY